MIRNYFVEYGDRTLEVSVDEGPDGYTVTIDGEPVRVDARAAAGGPTRSLLIDNRSFEAAAMKSRDGLDVYVSGDVFHLRVTDELQARVEGAGGAAGSGETVVSPMPGAVVAISVALGDEVAPGQTVAVIEAMKMQNEIAAVHGGTVSEIRAGAGDVVDQDAVLVVLAAETPDG